MWQSQITTAKPGHIYQLKKICCFVSQLVDMNESEMGWFTNHLGHDIDVHKEFYRLPQTTLDLAVVAKPTVGC